MTRLSRARLKRSQAKRDAWNEEARKQVPPPYTAWEFHRRVVREMNFFDNLPPAHREAIRKSGVRIT